VIVQGRWSAAELGLPAHATFRCLLPLPDGGMALGSDYGMVLWRGGRSASAFSPFPFPEGARRESRRVESMAAHEGTLYVASAKNWYLWPFAGEASGRSLPRDPLGVVDDLRAFHVTGDGALLTAWRTRLDGAEGPGDCVCFVSGGGATWAGTLDGELWRIESAAGSELVRVFADASGKPWPVRYLAWHQGALWVATGQALHRLEGGRWTERVGEPYDLHTAGDSLWTLRQGGLWRARGRGWPERVPVPLTRPWALGSDASGGLWIGEVGRVTRLSAATS